MLRQYVLQSGSQSKERLKLLKSEHGGWGKLAFSDISGLHAALCGALGEANFKKVLIGETSTSYLLPAASPLEAAFEQALASLGLEDLYSQRLDIREPSDAGVTRVILTLPCKDLVQSDVITPPQGDTPARFPVERIVKGDLLSVVLGPLHGKRPAPEASSYTKLHTQNTLVSASRRELIASRLPVELDPVQLQDKQSMELWFALRGDPAAMARNQDHYFTQMAYGFASIDFSALKNEPSQLFAPNAVLMDLEDWNALCKAKLFSGAMKRWLSQWGFWSLAFF